MQTFNSIFPQTFDEIFNYFLCGEMKPEEELDRIIKNLDPCQRMDEELENQSNKRITSSPISPFTQENPIDDSGMVHDFNQKEETNFLDELNPPNSTKLRRKARGNRREMDSNLRSPLNDGQIYPNFELEKSQRKHFSLEFQSPPSFAMGEGNLKEDSQNIYQNKMKKFSLDVWEFETYNEKNSETCKNQNESNNNEISIQKKAQGVIHLGTEPQTKINLEDPFTIKRKQHIESTLALASADSAHLVNLARARPEEQKRTNHFLKSETESNQDSAQTITEEKSKGAKKEESEHPETIDSFIEKELEIFCPNHATAEGDEEKKLLKELKIHPIPGYKGREVQIFDVLSHFVKDDSDLTYYRDEEGKMKLREKIKKPFEYLLHECKKAWSYVQSAFQNLNDCNDCNDCKECNDSKGNCLLKKFWAKLEELHLALKVLAKQPAEQLAEELRIDLTIEEARDKFIDHNYCVVAFFSLHHLVIGSSIKDLKSFKKKLFDMRRKANKNMQISSSSYQNVEQICIELKGLCSRFLGDENNRDFRPNVVFLYKALHKGGKEGFANFNYEVLKECMNQAILDVNLSKTIYTYQQLKPKDQDLDISTSLSNNLSQKDEIKATLPSRKGEPQTKKATAKNERKALDSKNQRSPNQTATTDTEVQTDGRTPSPAVIKNVKK